MCIYVVTLPRMPLWWVLTVSNFAQEAYERVLTGRIMFIDVCAVMLVICHLAGSYQFSIIIAIMLCMLQVESLFCICVVSRKGHNDEACLA